MPRQRQSGHISAWLLRGYKCAGIQNDRSGESFPTMRGTCPSLVDTHVYTRVHTQACGRFAHSCGLRPSHAAAWHSSRQGQTLYALPLLTDYNVDNFDNFDNFDNVDPSPPPPPALPDIHFRRPTTPMELAPASMGINIGVIVA